MIWLPIVSWVMFALVTTFHSIGIYLLTKEDSLNARFYLMSLSVSEIWSALIVAIYLSLDVKYKLALYVVIIIAHTMKAPYYFSMFILTLDRFCEIYFHMSYSNTWFYMNKIKVILIGWVFGIGHMIFLFILPIMIFELI